MSQRILSGEDDSPKCPEQERLGYKPGRKVYQLYCGGALRIWYNLEVSNIPRSNSPSKQGEIKAALWSGGRVEHGNEPL